MKDTRPGPGSSRGDRLAEVRRFGACVFCAVICFSFAIATATILLVRRSIDFDANIAAIASVAAGIVIMPFIYFGAIRKHQIVIPILRTWTILFLTLQSLIFLTAVAAWLDYGIRNPSIQAVDCFLAAGLSLIGLFFGTFGLIRGLRHHWFAHVLVPGYTHE